jgi:hypothetical protein
VRTIFFILLSLSGCVFAAENSPEFVTDLSFRTGWVSYRFYFTDTDFAGSPLWKPGNGEPPLLPNDAHTRAIEALKKLRPADWQLYSTVDIGLTRKNEDSQGRFYYYVHLYRLPESDKRATIPLDPSEERIFMFVVLLNGKVLQPQPIKTYR